MYMLFILQVYWGRWNCEIERSWNTYAKWFFCYQWIMHLLTKQRKTKVSGEAWIVMECRKPATSQITKEEKEMYR